MYNTFVTIVYIQTILMHLPGWPPNPCDLIGVYYAPENHVVFQKR